MFKCSTCGSTDNVRKVRLTYGYLYLCELCRLVEDIQREEFVRGLTSVAADQPACFAVDEARINEREIWRGNRPV
jgi:hypothetical protein